MIKWFKLIFGVSRKLNKYNYQYAIVTVQEFLFYTETRYQTEKITTWQSNDSQILKYELKNLEEKHWNIKKKKITNGGWYIR